MTRPWRKDERRKANAWHYEWIGKWALYWDTREGQFVEYCPFTGKRK